MGRLKAVSAAVFGSQTQPSFADPQQQLFVCNYCKYHKVKGEEVAEPWQVVSSPQLLRWAESYWWQAKRSYMKMLESWKHVLI